MRRRRQRRVLERGDLELGQRILRQHALPPGLGQLDQLCAKDDAEQLMSKLLRKFNAVTGLSSSAARASS